MQQVIDWNRIEKIHKEQPDYIFQWKYDGSYIAGDYQQLIGLRSSKLTEVIGFMKDPDKTSEIKQKIMQEEIKQIKAVFDAYSQIDFCSLTDLINQHYTNGFDDKCIDLKCSDYIDITKHEYDIKDIQTIVKAFCDEALARYMNDFVDWIMAEDPDWRPEGDFCHNNIVISIDEYGVDISYRPISIYAPNDTEV